MAIRKDITSGISSNTKKNAFALSYSFAKAGS